MEGSDPSSVALEPTAGPLLSPGSGQSAPLGPWEDPPRLRAAWEPRRPPVLEEEPRRGPLGGKGPRGSLEEAAADGSWRPWRKRRPRRTARRPRPAAGSGFGAGAGPRGSARAGVPSKSLSPNKTPLPAPRGQQGRPQGRL